VVIVAILGQRFAKISGLSIHKLRNTVEYRAADIKFSLILSCHVLSNQMREMQDWDENNYFEIDSASQITTHHSNSR